MSAQAPRSSTEIADGWIRAMGIPGFGISIPLLTGLYGELRPDSLKWWLGQALFIALAWVVWDGNRWLLFKQRAHVSWFGEPIQKLSLLLGAAIFYTAPVTVALLLLWYGALGWHVEWEIIRVVALANVICVLFVTHVYETVFLIKERRQDRLQVSELERARIQAELSALRAQVDPHFLFNSLNTLASLIDTDPTRAREFLDHLSKVYRYLLSNRDRDLVQLSDELSFLNSYVRLLQIRFGDTVSLSIHGLDAVDVDQVLIPPTALQVLMENAVKHNGFGRHQRLPVRLDVAGDRIDVTNPRSPKGQLRPSEGVGLSNLGERYRLATGAEIQIDQSPELFRVRLPLLGISQ